eukprot:3662661-Alexandrium_andersonii.AAC.1
MPFTNAVNLEPMSSPVQPPPPSVPGRVTKGAPQNPPVEQQQRGEPSLKGTDSNTLSNADQ